MTLYLVRLPDLQAALIEAASEWDLIMKLDERLDPALCTWEVYRGPVWVMLSPPISVEVAPPPGRDLRADDIEVGRIRRKDWPLVAAVAGSDTAQEMANAVMERVFPNLARAVADIDVIDREAIRAAVVKDVLAHDRATVGRGTAFDGERGLFRTDARYFRWAPGGTFTLLGRRAFETFAAGDARLQPDDDGTVRIVGVEVPVTRGADLAIASMALRLRIRDDGRVSEPHRAAAFSSALEDGLPGAARLRDRRNDGVRWDLTGAQLDALRRAICDKFPRVHRVDTSGVERRKRTGR